MPRRLAIPLALVLLFAAARSPAAPLKDVDLKKPAGPGRLFPVGAETVKVFVGDESGELIQSAGFDGAEDAAHFNGYWTRTPNGVQQLFEAASKDAVEALGMHWGPEGLVLSLIIQGYRIQNVSRGEGPVHFFFYLHLQAMLRSGDGMDLRSADYHFADYASSAKNPGEALSGLFARAAWQATARAILSYFPRKPEDAAMAKLAAGLSSADPAARARSAVWLGLAGGSAATAPLSSALRSETDLTVFSSIAGSLAELSAPGVRDELSDVLAGKAKWPARDPSRTEDAWVLIRSLALFGDRDLGSRVPASAAWRGRLTDLAQYAATGSLPVPGPVEAEGRVKSREWITGKK